MHSCTGTLFHCVSLYSRHGYMRVWKLCQIKMKRRMGRRWEASLMEMYKSTIKFVITFIGFGLNMYTEVIHIVFWRDYPTEGCRKHGVYLRGLWEYEAGDTLDGVLTHFREQLHTHMHSHTTDHLEMPLNPWIIGVKTQTLCTHKAGVEPTTPKVRGTQCPPTNGIIYLTIMEYTSSLTAQY